MQCQKCPVAPGVVCFLCGYEKRGNRYINVKKDERIKFLSETLHKMRKYNMQYITPKHKVYDESDVEFILANKTAAEITFMLEEHKIWEWQRVTGPRGRGKSVKTIAEEEELAVPTVEAILKRWE
jgi:hypothetical protein